jgi:hypothetical protein
VVLIDLDDENVVVEVPESFLSELPGLGFIEKGTLTLAAGELRFYYFLKTPQVVELLERLRWNKR